MRILIADDELPAVERLTLLLEGMEGVTVVGSAGDGQQALEAIKMLAPDLVLLDIQMPHLSGMGVAAGLDQDRRPEIVFVTAFESFAADAFEVEASDYLLKPVRYDRLRQAVLRADRRRRERAALFSQPPAASNASGEDCFWVPTRTGEVRVPVSSIDWIEADRDYVILHTTQRGHLVRMTMAAVQERLAGGGLIRVHRSAYVRPSRVVSVVKNSKWQISLIMEDGVSVPVGPSHRSRVLEAVRQSRLKT